MDKPFQMFHSFRIYLPEVKAAATEEKEHLHPTGKTETILLAEEAGAGKLPVTCLG